MQSKICQLFSRSRTRCSRCFTRSISLVCLAFFSLDLSIATESHRSFQSDDQPAKSIDQIDYYSFLPKEVLPSLLTKHYLIFILTSKNSLPDRHILKIVLRGERGFTSMLLLHHSSWNDTPFQAKHKDRFLLLASDVGKV